MMLASNICGVGDVHTTSTSQPIKFPKELDAKALPVARIAWHVTGALPHRRRAAFGRDRHAAFASPATQKRHPKKVAFKTNAATNATMRLWCGMHAQGLRVPASAEDCGTARGRGGVQALPRWHLPVWTALSQLSSAAGRGWRVAPQVCDDGVSVRRRLP